MVKKNEESSILFRAPTKKVMCHLTSSSSIVTMAILVRLDVHKIAGEDNNTKSRTTQEELHHLRSGTVRYPFTLNRYNLTPRDLSFTILTVDQLAISAPSGVLSTFSSALGQESRNLSESP